MYPEPPEPPPRPSSLPVFLGIVGMGGFLFFMIFVSGGLLLYVFFGCFVVFGMGMLHYLLWGASMHRQTEGEREEERLKREMEEERW